MCASDKLRRPLRWICFVVEETHRQFWYKTAQTTYELVEQCYDASGVRQAWSRTGGTTRRHVMSTRTTTIGLAPCGASVSMQRGLAIARICRKTSLARHVTTHLTLLSHLFLDKSPRI